MDHKIAPGLFDIIPDDPKETWRCSHIWQWVEATIRAVTESYGFREVRTPILERTELFEKGTGKDTDIVKKEMYTFEDKGGRMLTMRPEGTPPILRAFIEKQMHSQLPVQKLYYIGPMFRYERPQAGRYRQHHQFGAEAIGNTAPEQEVELIDMLLAIYRHLGLQGLSVQINSLGGENCREAFHYALKKHLEPHLEELSEDSRRRFETNPLRILDSKDEADKAVVADAPTIVEFLDAESREHFEQVKAGLDRLGIEYTVNPLLVRGLDYYNKTVFEVQCGELGAQNSIAGGGRFDGLTKKLGGPDLPTCGFGSGLERVIQAVVKQGVAIPEKPTTQVFFIALGRGAYDQCFSWVHELRQQGIAAAMDFTGKKLGKVMQYANNIGAKKVIVVGDDEIEKGILNVKDMDSGEKQEIAIDQLMNHFKPSNPLTDLLGGLFGGIMGGEGGGLQGLMGMMQNLMNPPTTEDEEKQEPEQK